MQSCADNMSVDGGFDALDYGFAEGGAKKSDPAILGERELWCAVIAQAFVDIGVIVPQTQGKKPAGLHTDRRKFDEALRWLLRDKSDFTYICDLAGVSPFIIRRAALMFYGELMLRTQS